MDPTTRTDAFRWIARNLAWSRRLDELRAARRPTPIWVNSDIHPAPATSERENRVA